MLGFDQGPEFLEREEEQFGVFVGDGVGGSSRKVDQRHFTEEGRGFQHRQGLFAAGALFGDAHRPLHDYEEAVTGVPLAEEDLSRLAAAPLTDDENLGTLRLVQVPEQG